MADSKRITDFDLLKGFGIFLVVMGHVLILCISDLGDAFLFKLIAKIHMPIFFFIAGYFSYKSSYSKCFNITNIKRRFIQLIIPFLVVSTIWVFFFPLSGLSFIKNPTIVGLYFHGAKYGYWFTPVLFVVIVICSLFTLFFKSIKSDVIVSIIVLLSTWLTSIAIGWLSAHFYSPLYDLLSMVAFSDYLPIFFAGLLAKKRNLLLYIQNNEMIFTISLVFVAFSLSINHNPSDLWLVFLDYLMRITTSLFIVIVLVHLAHCWCNAHRNRLFNTFIYLGKESLAIYLLHYFFLFPLTFLQQPMRDMGLGFVPCLAVSVAVAAAVVAVTLGVNYIISQSKLLSLLLTGKNQYR